MMHVTVRIAVVYYDAYDFAFMVLYYDAYYDTYYDAFCFAYSLACDDAYYFLSIMTPIILLIIGASSDAYDFAYDCCL